MNELYHYGVKGMKWGVRRRGNKDTASAVGVQPKERKRIDRKLFAKSRGYGAAQNRVVDKFNTDRIRDTEFTQKWDAAFKAGKGSKEYKAFEQYALDYRNKYKDEYVDAWLKDNNIKKISEEGRRYVKDNIWT